MSFSAGAVPLYGTCVSFDAVASPNISAVRCIDVPLPGVPCVIGCALAAAM